MGEEEKKTAEEEKKVEVEGKKGEEKKKQEAAEKKAVGGAEGEKKDADGKKDGEGDGKTAEGGGGGGKGEGEKKETPPPPPPEEIVMRVYMHCEGCARKVQRSLAGFPGVEEVKVDCRAHMVVVKGKAAAADPLRVVERLQMKSGRKVELLSPIPPKPEEEEAKKEEEKPKPQEEEAPPVIEAVLKVRMHCDACSQEMKKRILKMKGVQSADPDVKASQVTVKGVFDPAALAEHVYRRTGRHAALVKAEPVEEKAPGKEVDKAEGGGGGDGEADKAAGGEGEKAEAAADGGAAANDGAAAGKGVEVTKNPYYYHHHHYYSSYPRCQVEHTYPPQIFSDDNPNACSVM